MPPVQALAALHGFWIVVAVPALLMVLRRLSPRHRALKNFEAKYPLMANNPVFVKPKLILLPKLGEVDEAKKVAQAVVAKAIAQDNPSALMQVAALLRNGPGKESCWPWP